MNTLIRLIAAAALLVVAPAYAGHHQNNENIVETAASAGQFETLIAAAKAAGLAAVLSGDGPLTVFAPTDDAFGALPAGTIEELLKKKNRKKLAEILKLHVVSGRVGSDALADGASLTTLGGKRVTFTATEGGFSVNGARILKTDIGASNGVVHVIDRVLLPTKQMSRRDAVDTIDRAIARGVPEFNHGRPEATVQIYTQAARALLASGPLGERERMRLQDGMRASAHSVSDRASAWEMRYALDDVAATLRR